MLENRRCLLWLMIVISLGLWRLPEGCSQEQQPADKPNQYEFENIVIAAADAEESTLPAFVLKPAVDYIEQAALAWSKSRRCVSCHTNGSYLVVRPALTPQLGRPSEEIRQFFVEALDKHLATERDKLRSGIRPTQIAYIAAGLAEWDAHVIGRLSPETDRALRLMFELQSDDGSFHNADCWPPFESSPYHGATVAALAVATAPGWLETLDDERLTGQIEKLKTYLQTTPPHDYARLLLLWTSTRMESLLSETARQELIETVWKHQQPDGGWSIRTFAQPEAWGRGNRAEKLRSEPEFANPPSDGHQTGLAVIVLRDAGVPADEPRIRRAVDWLLSNQRESGRWWTRSLNTDEYHFITYSGTCYPLLALAKCNALPAAESR